MKFNIAYPRTGAQKMYNVDDEHKWGKLVDRRLGQEFDGDILGEEFKGYVFKISGGTDCNGVAMKQGILVKGRVRIVLEPGNHIFQHSTIEYPTTHHSLFASNKMPA